MHDMTLSVFLPSSFVVGVVQTHSHSRSAGLSVESHLGNVPPALVLSQRFVERQLHGDGGAGSAEHDGLGRHRSLLDVDVLGKQGVGVVERRRLPVVMVEVSAR